MQKVLNRFSQHTFVISRSFIVVAVSMISNVFAYIFQLITGRYFSVEEYGQLTSLFALSGIIPLTLTAFTGAIPKLVAEIKDKDYPREISKLFFTLLKFHLLIGILILGIMILQQNQIAEYLQINNNTLIVYFSFAVASGMTFSFIAPFMQGLMRFKALSAVTFITALTKFLVGIYVVYFLMPLKDIFSGLAISTLIVGILSIFALKKNLSYKEFNTNDKENFKKLIEYSLLSSLSILGLFLMQNIDIIEVKHLFDPAIAGIYGSTGVIGKIIFYAASPVALVMMPICAEKFKKNENFLKPFSISIALVILIALTGTLVYSIFPELTIRTLFGIKYLAAKDYLPMYSIYMLVYTILYFITLFLLAISRFKIASLAMIAAIIQYFGIKFFANNLNDVILISTVASLSMTLILIGYIIKLYKNAN